MKLNTPISYYGGKQNMVSTLLPMLDYSKEQFVSLFTGGAAVEFAKRRHEVEVWNDLDADIVNFWEVSQSNELFDELSNKIQHTLHSEKYHKDAQKILKAYNKEKEYSKVDRAWAVWVQTNMSFGNVMFGGFAFANDNSRNKQTMNKREAFKKAIYDRVKLVQLFNRDAIDLLLLKDSEKTFFFADPPYYQSDMGHYDGYSEADFLNLLDKLSKIKGTFLLTSYPSEHLMYFRKKHGWYYEDKDMPLGVDGTRGESKRKIECITFNYKLQLDMFEGMNF